MSCKSITIKHPCTSPRVGILRHSYSQHRVSPFRLIDPTLPGHRRFIALWLVNPTMRILSTANVPPQQMSWWLDSLLGSSKASKNEALAKLPPEIVALLHDKGLAVGGSQTKGNTTLPAEVMEMVRTWFGDDEEAMPMRDDEAREHRVGLMRERSAFLVKAEEGWQRHSYSFCEH